MQIASKPAKHARRAISTVKRGPASKVRLRALDNVENLTKGEIGIISHGDSSGTASSNDVPLPIAAATNNIQSVPATKNSETLNTLAATNALLTDQLIENNKSFQQLEQKYIRALEQFYVEGLKKLELQTKMDKQRCKIEELEMKIAEIENAAFCDDLIQLNGTREIPS